MSSLSLSEFELRRVPKNHAYLPRTSSGSRSIMLSSSRMYYELTFRVSSMFRNLQRWKSPIWLRWRRSFSIPWACLSRNLFLALVQTLWTRVFSRRTALISCLSWGSALCRFQAARLAATAMLISASAWASPLQPRPGSLVARGGATRSAVCSMAVVKAVSTSSTLLPLGGNALRWSPIAVATCWRKWESVISLCRSIGGGPFASLAGRLRAKRPSSFDMCCDDVVIRDR